MSDYICPNCGSEDLTANNNNIICTQCNSTFDLVSSIPVFRNYEAKFEWGDYQNKIENLISESSEKGWHNEFLEFQKSLGAKQGRSVWNRSYGPRRNALNLLLPLTENKVILDYGSGLGNISRELANHCKTLYSFDQLPNHILWQYNSNNKDTNIKFLIGGGTKFLPLKTNTIDIVIMNGVLEWAASNSKGDPYVAQLFLLKEINRILKPGGILFIGIENRINYKYFLGQKEGHIKMKYGSLLPRKITDLYLRIKRGIPFREYTYSFPGYKRILNNAGFSNVAGYSSWPHYGNIYSVLPFESNKLKSYSFNSSSIFSKFPFKYFSKSFLIIGCKSDTTEQNLLEKVISEVREKHINSKKLVVLDILFKITSTGKAIIKIIDDNQKKHLIKVGTNHISNNYINQNQKALKFISPIFPHNTQQVKYGSVTGFSYSVENYIEGFNQNRKSLLKGLEKSAINSAYKFLVKLSQNNGELIKLDNHAFKIYISPYFTDLLKWFTKNELNGVKQDLKNIEEYINNYLLDQQFILVPAHGDFVPNNIKFNENGEIETVTDWDLFQESSLPLYDLITFIGRVRREKLKENRILNGEDLKNVKYLGYPEIFIYDENRAYLENYLLQIKLDRSFINPLIILWWLKQMKDWRPLYQYNPEWKEYKLFPILERIKQVLVQK